MDNTDTSPKIGLIGILIGLSILFIVLIVTSTEKKTINKEQISHDRLLYIKDSLEMEFYKKQLESYPYDHSEIKDTTIKK